MGFHGRTQKSVLSPLFDVPGDVLFTPIVFFTILNSEDPFFGFTAPMSGRTDVHHQCNHEADEYIPTKLGLEICLPGDV
ncbi:hypothetical protein [Methanogenium organophilum]|uniref:Uncharacterized protein n=1 Tax=Methanogenium organophilum TaxID=2199 RepID=A0A9X9S3J9_METOG|nr:hypothetical protein [Methanogenium organophilum]WAI00853.1 hypothetical protein OU421_10580 [Methanogenium organophilum]